MVQESFHFKLGSFECLIVLDDLHTYPPPDTRFSSAPKNLLAEVLHRYDLNLSEERISPYPVVHIDTGTHQVIVDTGIGDFFDPAGRNMTKLLMKNGVSPEKVDLVINTHAHRDHIGGNTDSAGRPTFPNASYVIWKAEWDYWFSKEALAVEPERRITAVNRKWKPFENRLIAIDEEKEIVPGITAIAAPGHTAGHMAIFVSSEDVRMVCLADAFLHPIHIEHPEWFGNVDHEPEQTVATRRRLIDMVLSDRSLVHAFHFPFPGLGHIAKAGDGWKWEPIESTGLDRCLGHRCS